MLQQGVGGGSGVRGGLGGCVGGVPNPEPLSLSQQQTHGERYRIGYDKFVYKPAMSDIFWIFSCEMCVMESV